AWHQGIPTKDCQQADNVPTHYGLVPSCYKLYINREVPAFWPTLTVSEKQDTACRHDDKARWCFCQIKLRQQFRDRLVGARSVIQTIGAQQLDLVWPLVSPGDCCGIEPQHICRFTKTSCSNSMVVLRPLKGEFFGLTVVAEDLAQPGICVSRALCRFSTVSRQTG